MGSVPDGDTPVGPLNGRRRNPGLKAEEAFVVLRDPEEVGGGGVDVLPLLSDRSTERDASRILDWVG